MKGGLCCFTIVHLIVHITATTYTTLLGALGAYTELSTLSNYVNDSSTVRTLLTEANNFTFFAPSNSAIESLIGTYNNDSLASDELDAILQYSLIHGGYSRLSFSNTPQFIASNLLNASYANVSGGQVVDLVLDSDDTPQVITGNKNVSSISLTVRT